MFFSGEGIGQAPRRTAFQEAIRATVNVGGYWTQMGDVMVPNEVPVTDSRYWRTTGALLALALLAGEGLHPISPVVVYALLSNLHHQTDPAGPMNLSLHLIQQLDRSKADILRVWMIIPPGRDWRKLPDGHRNQVTNILGGLGLNVSGTILITKKSMTIFF